jgi:hypothetical protein
MTDNLRRWLDPRAEERCQTRQRTAILNHRGHSHVVGLINVSSAGAMIDFPGDLAEGETVTVQLFDQDSTEGRVRWVRDGRAGIYFGDSEGSVENQE